MTRASHSRRKFSRNRNVDANYFIRILGTVKQAAAKFSEFVLQPDDFLQINTDLAVGAAVLVWRGDASVFEALVSATARGYLLAEGWGWQNSNSSCQQAVMLLSRMSFCLKACVTSVPGDKKALGMLSHSDKEQLMARLSNLVAQAGKTQQYASAVETWLINRLAGFAERARNVIEAWTAADSDDQLQQQQQPGNTGTQQSNLMALQKCGIMELSASSLALLSTLALTWPGIGEGEQCAAVIASNTSIHLLLLTYLALVAKAVHEQQDGWPAPLQPSSNTPYLTKKQQKELVLLQPGLASILTSLSATCCLIDRNAGSKPCPEKVAKQLLQELLPVLMERQLPGIQHIFQESVMSSGMFDECDDTILVCAGAEVIMLSKMALARRHCFDIMNTWLTAFKPHVAALSFLLEAYARTTQHQELVEPEQVVEVASLILRLSARREEVTRGSVRFLQDRQEHYLGSTFEPGKPLTSGGIAVVRASKSRQYTEGDVISGMFPWSSHFVLQSDSLGSLQKIDKSLLGKVPLSYFLGVLGMPGMTAYTSLKKIAEPRQGEVAFVSAASGAVGQVVGQLLKQVYGCQVIGSAGSDDKVALLKELGYDYAFNYKKVSFEDAMKKAAPDGIDIYYENVGGETLKKVLDVARPHARVVACGMISQYNLPNDEKYGVKNLFQEGKVRPKEHLTDGIANAGAAFVEMMAGGNVGKAVVKIAAEDPFPVKTP
eukprot:gene9107-9276_t